MLSPFPFHHPPPLQKKTPISSSLPLLLWWCCYTHPPTHSHLPTLNSSTLGHLYLFHRTKDLSSHWCMTKLHMQLEPCVLLCWWLSSGELWGVWLVDIFVLLMGLQTPSTPSVLSLTPLLGTLCSPQWLTVSICLFICKVLAGPFRRQPYHAPFSMHFLASTMVSGFGDCIWDGSPGGTVSGWPFLQSLLYTLSLYLLLCVFCSPSKTEAPTLWSSFFLSFMWSVNCILVIWSFWVNLYFSVSAYHVCSLAIGLPQLGYFLVLSIFGFIFLIIGKSFYLAFEYLSSTSDHSPHKVSCCKNSYCTAVPLFACLSFKWS
jgi:hypothetical protein